MNNASYEYTRVERPLIDQLKSMGWAHIEGDTQTPGHTERQSFREVRLKERLRGAIRRINRDDTGEPWMDDGRVNQAVSALERLGEPNLMEANQRATELLTQGTTVEGDSERHAGREQTVHFIDYDHAERNDFLVINQFRVDPPWAVGDKDYIIPDLVLFVNGIPLVVIECKSPDKYRPGGGRHQATAPLHEPTR
jgi:type I restriction enzyme R subunit